MTQGAAPYDTHLDGATVEYDLAVTPVADALKDYIVARALVLVGRHLDCGPNLATDRPITARDALSSLRAPVSRAHAHHHLLMAADALCAGPDAPLAVLEVAWRDLTRALGENGHGLIDLSQCCGGHLNLTTSRRTFHGL